MRFIIDFIYLLAALAISPKVIYRLIRQNRYRTGWADRFGRITRTHGEKKCIWIHAVSVGEVNAARTIISRLRQISADFEILITTTTDTGFARAKALYGTEHDVFYFPFDFSSVMRRAFARIRPAICLLMELEVWPNLVQIANERDIPIVVVNARISDKTFPRYRRIRPVIRPMFNRLALVLAQTEEYAQRFKDLGCDGEKVIVTGSLKYDTAQITDKLDGTEALASQLGLGTEPFWVAGGTGPGEEKILLDVFAKLKQQGRFAPLRFAVIPRKPERFEEVARLIQQAGFQLIRYSRIKHKPQPQAPEKNAVILGDTMGDLRRFYSLATIAFIGRSLVPMGGSDMIEAAALGKCIIFGPHTFNFKQTVDALLAACGAIVVNNTDELLRVMQKCLTDEDFAATIAANARRVIQQNQGATDKAVTAIMRLLKHD